MAKYFEKNGEFVFPAGVLPQSGSVIAPEAPQHAANRLAKLFPGISTKSETDQVSWATETLFNAEIYGSVSSDMVSKSVELLESKAKTNALASYVVGNWYLFGLFGHDANKHRAKEFYRISIKLQGGRAWYRMGSSAEEKGDIDRAVSRYECGAKLGDAACIYRLAIAILKGHFGYAKDPQKAVKLLQQACETADEDFPQPFFLLGLIIMGEVEQGIIAPNRAKGTKLLEKAASLHFAPALVRLAAAHQQNIVPFDSATVFRYLHCVVQQERYLVFQKLAPQFNGDPEVQLTKLFLCGAEPLKGPNEEWAYKFAVAGAECNNGTAQFAIGYFAEVGIYIQRDLALATTMYEQSSRNNCEAAKQRLDKFEKLNTGNVDLQRSATLTRKDHDQALQRTISRDGKNATMNSIVESLGKKLTGTEFCGDKSAKVDLLDPAPAAPAAALAGVTTNATSPPASESQANLSAAKTTGYPTNSEPMTITKRTPYPVEVKKAPYPADRPTQQLQLPEKSTTGTISIVHREEDSTDAALGGVVDTPYPSGEQELEPVKKPEPTPVKPEAIKSPYPLPPAKIINPKRDTTKPASSYPEDLSLQKTAMFIPDSPDRSSVRSQSPVQLSPPRARSPVRSFTSSFSSPSWVKGHSRSHSSSPERPPSPGKRSSMSFLSKMRNRLSISEPIDGLGNIEFDQQGARAADVPPGPQKMPCKSTNIQGGKHNIPPYPVTAPSAVDSVAQKPLLAQPLVQVPDPAVTAAPQAAVPVAQPFYRTLGKSQTFDTSLGSIQENEMHPGARTKPMSSPPSRSGTPVHRKPIGSSVAIGTSNGLRINNNSGSNHTSPDRSPTHGFDSLATSKSETPLSSQAISPISTTSTQGSAPLMIKPQSRRGGHKHSMSMASPESPTRAELNSGTRVISSPLKPQQIKQHEMRPAPNHHALSFDDMGIKHVVEDKAGPCVIA